MTVKIWGAKEYTYTSADAKPPSHSGLVDARLTETDTGNVYRNSGNDWVIVQGKAKQETLTGKTMVDDIGENTFVDLAVNNPFQSANKRTGSILASPKSLDSCIGALSGLSVVGDGTPKLVYIDSTEGYAHQFTRVATGQMGFASTSSTDSIITRRAYNPYFITRFRISNTSGSRLAIGFTSATTIPNSDTLLGFSDYGILFGFRTIDSTFMTFHSDGAIMDDIVMTGQTKDTNWHTVSFTFGASNIVVKLDDGTGTKTQTVSTEIPLTTTDLKLSVLGMF